MASEEDIEGIAGDKKFVNCIYMNSELEKDYDTTKVLNEKNRRFCWFYLMALDFCLTQVDNNSSGDIRQTYFDWIRWNQAYIVEKLEKYLAIPDLVENYDAIRKMIQRIERFAETHLQLNAHEKGVSNQFAHAYNLSLKKNDIRVLQQAGKLLINYLTGLTKRYYINTVDRADYSVDQLKSEANHLITELESKDKRLALDIKETLHYFLEFSELDEAAAFAQEEILQKSLELADIQARENIFQNLLRQIKKIKKEAGKKMGKLVKWTTYVRRDAWNDLKRIGKAFISMPLHPIDTMNAFKTFAKENPWKFAFIVIGSLAVGIAFGGLFTGAIILVDVFLVEAIALPVAADIAIGLTSSMAAASTVSTLAVTGGTILPVQMEAQKQIDEIKVALKREQARKNSNSRREQAKKNNSASQATHNADSEEADDSGNDSGNDDVGTNENNERTSTASENLMITNEEIINRIEEFLEREIQDDAERKSVCEKEIAENQKDQKEVQVGLNALNRLMQKKKDKHPVPPKAEENVI
uniref:Uncharacterized protein n=1 Tax=Panagrolaimus davidi TaxID=227884 RepID=A0A914P8F3_9BILA